MLKCQLRGIRSLFVHSCVRCGGKHNGHDSRLDAGTKGKELEAKDWHKRVAASEERERRRERKSRRVPRLEQKKRRQCLRRVSARVSRRLHTDLQDMFAEEETESVKKEEEQANAWASSSDP